MIRALFLICCLSLSSCVLPPTVSNEFETLSLVSRAKALAERGRFDQSEILLRKAWLSGGLTSEIANDLGYVMIAQGREFEARMLLLEALELQPNNFAAKTNLARLYYKNGNLEQTATMLESAYLLNQKSSNFLADNLIVAEFYRGNIDEALCLAEHRLLTSPSPVTSNQYLKLLLLASKYDKAAELLTDSNPPVLRGQVLLLSGDTELAKKEMLLVSKSSSFDYYLAELILSSIDDSYKISRRWDDCPTQFNEEFVTLSPTLVERLFPLHSAVCS